MIVKKMVLYYNIARTYFDYIKVVYTNGIIRSVEKNRI